MRLLGNSATRLVQASAIGRTGKNPPPPQGRAPLVPFPSLCRPFSAIRTFRGRIFFLNFPSVGQQPAQEWGSWIFLDRSLSLSALFFFFSPFRNANSKKKKKIASFCFTLCWRSSRLSGLATENVASFDISQQKMYCNTKKNQGR